MEEERLEELFLCLGNKQNERKRFLDKFLSLCQPSDMAHMSMKLDIYKQDLMKVLPTEVVEIILSFLDWKELLKCAQVCLNWEREISGSFNTLWLRWCLRTLPINEFKLNEIDLRNNYKRVFLQTLRNSAVLEKGNLFRNWSIGPAEISAIYVYDNILATGESIKK